jgi:hypothetical protein
MSLSTKTIYNNNEPDSFPIAQQTTIHRRRKQMAHLHAPRLSRVPMHRDLAQFRFHRYIFNSKRQQQIGRGDCKHEVRAGAQLHKPNRYIPLFVVHTGQIPVNDGVVRTQIQGSQVSSNGPTTNKTKKQTHSVKVRQSMERQQQLAIKVKRFSKSIHRPHKEK